MHKKFNDRLNEWKGQAEHLWLQMNLGASEAEDQYEKQKKELSQWVDEMKLKVDELPEKSSKKIAELQQKLDELKLEAELATAKSKEKLKIQQEKLSSKLSGLKEDVKEVYEDSSEKAEDFKENAEEKLSYFQTRFDLFKVQLHLGTKEAQELWEKKKKEAAENLKNIDKKLDAASDVTGEMLTNVNNDLKKSWGKLKDVFK